MQGRDELIAAPWHRFNKAGTAGIITERLAQLGHRDIEALIELDQPIGPKRLFEFLTGDPSTLALQQGNKQPKGLLLEFYLPTLPKQFARVRARFKLAEAKNAARSDR